MLFRSGESTEIFGTESAESLSAPSGGMAAADTAVPEGASGRRPEPEVVLVPMQPDQELVYGWMGLNPTLLLDTQPSGEEVVVRVVRPDTDPDAVLSEARQQLSHGGSRRRRRGRGGGEARGAAAIEAGTSPASAPNHALPDGFEAGLPVVEILPVPVEPSVAGSPLPIHLEVPLSLTSHGRAAVLGTGDSASPVAVLVPAGAASDPPSDDEQGPTDPRRRRRRSSAGV